MERFSGCPLGQAEVSCAAVSPSVGDWTEICGDGQERRHDSSRRGERRERHDRVLDMRAEASAGRGRTESSTSGVAGFRRVRPVFRGRRTSGTVTAIPTLAVGGGESQQTSFSGNATFAVTFGLYGR